MWGVESIDFIIYTSNYCQILSVSITKLSESIISDMSLSVNLSYHLPIYLIFIYDSQHGLA